MKLGVLLSPADSISDRAAEIEETGFDSIWSAHAMGRGFLMTDPFVALATAAGATKRVELGVAILQLPLYNATDIAIKALSLNNVSNGRFLLGLGAGSTESDYVIHREDFSNRFKTFEERLVQLRATLSDGSANGGNIGDSGGPPLLYGTWGKNVSRAATEFDGWIASAMHRSVEQCCEAIQSYRESGGKRAIVSTIHVEPSVDLEELGAKLAAFEAAGFDDAVLFPHPGCPPLGELRKLVG